MATFDRTVTLERIVTQVRLNENGTVTVMGYLAEAKSGRHLIDYEEDVRASLPADKQAMVTELLTAAQNWLDNQPINI